MLNRRKEAGKSKLAADICLLQLALKPKAKLTQTDRKK
jgi:hypothetical protein